MISPVRPGAGGGSPLANKNLNLAGFSMMREESSGDSSPIEDSPTPACGVASATARLKLVDEESPIRKVPGQSRSLRPGPDGNVGVFGYGDRKRVPTSPLKFSTDRSDRMDEDEEDGDHLPPTPSLTYSPAIPQPRFSATRHAQANEGISRGQQGVFGGGQAVGSCGESRIPRLSTSHPLRARSGTSIESDRPALGGKKAVSLDQIPVSNDADEPFGHPFNVAPPATGKKLRPAHGSIGSTTSYRAHKRINSGDYQLAGANASISRSHGHKSGLALSLSPGLKLPEFGSSSSSLSSLSTNNLTPPASAFSPAEPPIFEDIKPLDQIYIPEQTTVERKFKPRDSSTSLAEEAEAKSHLQPPPSVMRPSTYLRRPAMPKRTSSAGDERKREKSVETPGVGPTAGSGWPTGGTFQFVGENGATMNMRLGPDPNEKPSMPGTPVKKQAYGAHPRIGHSNSQPSLASETFETVLLQQEAKRDRKSAPSAFVPPQSTKKPSAKQIPHLTLTATSPDSPTTTDTDLSSPTVRLSSGHPTSSTLGPIPEAPAGRVGLLRRLSSGVGSSDGSEDEGTPTKPGGDKSALAAAQVSAVTNTPTPKTNLAAAVRANNGSSSKQPGSIMPRMSLPAVAAPKTHRTLHHRQSHPATSTVQPEEEDIFEQRFITLETIGKGAFSTVMKVQERFGEGLYAVKKARGVFDGVRDRSVSRPIG